MISEPLVLTCTCEIAGRVRGKGFPASELQTRLKTGVGWVPTNTMISALGPIADTPFGALDDLILVPDPDVRVEVDFGDGSASERWYLGDIRRTNGTPWECCPREFLRRGLRDLGAEGFGLYGAFEHEFTLPEMEDRPGAPYSLDAYRRQGRFGEVLTAAMRQAGLEPDSFMAEYAARQYEVTMAPASGIRIADNAVILREMVRATAFRLDQRASFAPIMDPAGVGNGVHLHFSLTDRDGRPATHEAGRPLGLSPGAAHFMAGIATHLPAIVAVTAPCPVSYIRLRPNRWAPTQAYLAAGDREASLRICPVLDLPGLDKVRQFHAEYRPADGAASPYLALGVIVHAGVDGMRRKIPLKASKEEAPALPQTLGEALDRLEATPEARDWFGPVYLDAYLRHKRAELLMVADKSEEAQCALYASSY
jgi:glutamine synthetase